MAYLSFQSQYDKFPETRVTGYEDQVWAGYAEICREMMRRDPRIMVVECYPGVEEQALTNALQTHLQADHVLSSREIFLDAPQMEAFLRPFLTEDRVRGRMFYGTIDDAIDQEKLACAREKLAGYAGRVLVLGFGASKITRGDVLVYADMTRWEIQLRQRKGQSNALRHNPNEEPLRKNKLGYFVEWRMADRLKTQVLPHSHYYLDTNTMERPVMTTPAALHAGLQSLTTRPFRLVPYFDPGVWGGQWMKEVCGLDPDKPNYAWSFDGVPEENSLYFRIGPHRLETPAMNLVLLYPIALLGERNYARFGAEYPIRFDFLDTMAGQNLSLQVHPCAEYIKQHFGMTYTQDESYYILDAEPGARVYLGMKNSGDFDDMIAALRRAQEGDQPFDAERYINSFPAKKHDHFLIPAGTIHCSGAGCMVLEVSATPYIFTFKLWDWDRVDLNGKPRPIHIDDGEQVIRRERDTRWVEENLMNRFETITEEAGYTRVKTGLHPLEFIETHVLTGTEKMPLGENDGFSMLNLVDGQAAIVESPEGRFAPFTVHYAETLILPAQCGKSTLRPAAPGAKIKALQAWVRHG